MINPIICPTKFYEPFDTKYNPITKTTNLYVYTSFEREANGKLRFVTAYRDRGRASPLSPAGGGHPWRNSGARWWKRNQPRYSPAHATAATRFLVLVHLGKHGSCLRSEKGATMAALDGTGEAAGGHGGRQPAALAAKAVAAPTFANQSTGAVDGLAPRKRYTKKE